MGEMKRLISCLADFPRNARVRIYGAGEIGVSLFLLLREQRPDIQVAGFVDGFKQGALHGVDIIRPETLLEAMRPGDMLVVTSVYFRDQIEQTLKNLGIEGYYLLNPVFNSGPFVSSEIKSEVEGGNAVLYAFYDRAVSPDGFDIVNFLYLAEIERVRRGCTALHPVIVPQPHDFFVRKGEQLVSGKSDRASFRDQETSRWWERHILLPCCWLMPSCNGVSLCSSRQESAIILLHLAQEVFPAGYRVETPIAEYSWSRIIETVQGVDVLPSFAATLKGLSYVDRWIKDQVGDRKIVSITLRENPVHADRNSNVADWLRFARSLDTEVFCPVILRDTSVALSNPPKELDGLLIFCEASWNMELRMALYERSYVNMFTASGPSVLAQFNRRTRLLRFHTLREGVFECSAAHMEADGIPLGAQLPGATSFQRSIWEGERFEVMTREFEKLCRDIEEEVV